MASKNIIVNTPFPLYVVKWMHTKNCLLIAGGGGQAKTGVINAIEIFEVNRKDGLTKFHKLVSQDTGPNVIMNSSQFSSELFATGQGEKCRIYKLHSQIPVSEGKVDKFNEQIVDLEECNAIQTDFSEPEPFQRVVCFTPNHSKLITGGGDGFVRVWQYPSLNKLLEFKVGKSEIDDIDVSPSGEQFVTTSKDGTISVWKSTDASKVCDIKWDSKTTSKYRVRSCRFGIVPDKKNEYMLYTAHIPVVRSQKVCSCYLTSWHSDGYKQKASVRTGEEILSALAVSSDGVFVGVGTISGSVSVYIAFSLQRLYHVKETHKIFVTGLEFAPNNETCRALLGGNEFSLFSISADNTVQLHQLPPRGTYSIFWLAAGLLIAFYLLFWLLNALQL